MDEWLTIEERKERFIVREKAVELKREYKKKGIDESESRKGESFDWK